MVTVMCVALRAMQPPQPQPFDLSSAASALSQNSEVWQVQLVAARPVHEPDMAGMCGWHSSDRFVRLNMLRLLRCALSDAAA